MLKYCHVFLLAIACSSAANHFMKRSVHPPLKEPRRSNHRSDRFIEFYENQHWPGLRSIIERAYRDVGAVPVHGAVFNEIYNPNVRFLYGLEGAGQDASKLLTIKRQVHVLNTNLENMLNGAQQALEALPYYAKLVSDLGTIKQELQTLDSMDIDSQSGKLVPSDTVHRWADHVLQTDRDGVLGALTRLDAIMKGDRETKAFGWTMLGILSNQSTVPDSQVIWIVLDDLLQLMTSSQTAGYLIHVVALNTKGDTAGTKTVQQIAAQRRKEQDKVLAALKDPAIRHWPSGTYGLVKPQGGCPAAEAGWRSGWRFQDTEDWKPDNRWSSGIHIAGDLEKNNVKWAFCVKTTVAGPVSWPAGTYCIFKKEICPGGFKEGWVFWDDQDIRNTNGGDGDLPDGVYDRNTLIYFCCRTDGSSLHPIVLPILRPFYLFAMQNAGCQEVMGMQARDEWVWWDEENTRLTAHASSQWPHPKDTDITGKNHQIHMCYYEKN